MSELIRFTVPTEIANRWRREALRIGVAFPEYTRLRCLGVIRDDKPVAPDTAELLENPGALGPRILEKVKQFGWEKISTPHGVNKLAVALGVDRRRMHGALGSLVASKRLRRSVYGYHPVKDVEDLPQIAD